MEKVLHRLVCPKCIFYTSIKTFSGILGGAGFFPSTVSPFNTLSAARAPCNAHSLWRPALSWWRLQRLNWLSFGSVGKRDQLKKQHHWNWHGYPKWRHISKVPGTFFPQKTHQFWYLCWILGRYTPSNTNCLHLKMDGWNTIVSFWGKRPIFRVLAVSSRECTPLKIKGWNP